MKVRSQSQEMHAVKVLTPILPACIAHSECVHLFYLRKTGRELVLVAEAVPLCQAAELSVRVVGSLLTGPLRQH